jgi:hypothetical protein
VIRFHVCRAKLRHLCRRRDEAWRAPERRPRDSSLHVHRVRGAQGVLPSSLSMQAKQLRSKSIVCSTSIPSRNAYAPHQMAFSASRLILPGKPPTKSAHTRRLCRLPPATISKAAASCRRTPRGSALNIGRRHDAVRECDVVGQLLLQFRLKAMLLARPGRRTEDGHREPSWRPFIRACFSGTDDSFDGF